MKDMLSLYPQLIFRVTTVYLNNITYRHKTRTSTKAPFEASPYFFCIFSHLVSNEDKRLIMQQEKLP